MILFYILVLTAPMPNHPLFEEPFAGLTLVKWLGIVCSGYALFLVLKQRRLPNYLGPWPAKCFLVFIAIATVSYITLSRSEGLSFNPMLTYVSYVLLFFTAVSLVNTPERLHKTLLAAIAGAAWASLYVIREYQASAGTNMRPGYIAGDSNYFATCTVLVIPVAIYFMKMKTHWAERWFCGVSLLLMLVAFTLASSRGGLVGLIVTIAYMVLLSGRSRRTVIVTTLLFVPMLVLSPASPLARMLHPGYGDVIAEQIRRDFWAAGMGMIANHPLTGIGLGNFTFLSHTTIEGKQGMACNTFLEVAAEMGIPAFVAYCGIVIGSFLCAGKLRTAGKERKDAVLLYTGQAMQAGLLGFAAAAVFVSAEYQKPFWVIVALAAAIPLILRRTRKSVPAPVIPAWEECGGMPITDDLVAEYRP